MSARNTERPMPQIPQCPTPSTPNCLHWTEEDWKAFDEWALTLHWHGPLPANIGEEQRASEQRALPGKRRTGFHRGHD